MPRSLVKHPSFKSLPKTILGNLQYRYDLLERAKSSAAVRADIVKACQDPLWFFCGLCWLYEPRPKKGGSRVIPFIPWDHQVPTIEAIRDNVGEEDISVEKSRGEGMSWIAVLMALHAFLFSEDMGAVGFISKSEKDADCPGDMDSLMEKAYWELKQLPKWLAGKEGVDWKRHNTKHLIKNNRNDFSISAFSATGDVASGGRKTFIVFDELAKFPRPADEHAMASTQHVTNSRLIISTPKGTEGAYYRVMHEPSNMVKLTLDWKANPSRNRGLYKIVRGKPQAVDPENNPLPRSYDPPDSTVQDTFSLLRRRGFKLEGVIRSPWYDHECARPGATPQNIAQELDRSYGGSMYRIFGADFMGQVEKTTKQPIKRGNITVNEENLKNLQFDAMENGPVSLWCSLDMDQLPPPSTYGIGVDICSGIAGSHTSNSIITVLDLVKQEQVLEYYSNAIPPADWAEHAVAIAHWFHTAYLAWEHNGPGSAFTRRVLELNYGHIYYRKNQHKRRGKSVTTSREPGWFTNAATKEVLFSDIQRLVAHGDWIIRSADLAKECGQYVRETGKIKHVKYAGEDDSNSHGDRVFAYGIALQAAKDRPVDRSDDKVRDDRPLPPDTLAARVAKWEMEDAKEASPWDSTTLADMARGSSMGVTSEWI